MKFILALIMIAIIIYHRWLSGSVFTYGDWWYFFPETMRTFLPISVWNTISGFGSFDLTLWRFPVINIPYGIFGALGHGQEIAEKFAIFWPTILVGNLGTFFLVKKVHKSNLSGLIGALVFNYNTYYLGNTAVLLYSAGAWAVLSLLLFIETLEKKNLTIALLTGISIFICGSYDLRIGYILIFLQVFYLIFHMMIIKKNNKKKDIIRMLYYASVPIFFFVSLSTYWVLPSIGTSSLTSNAIINRPLFGNEFLNINYAFTFFHPFWTGAKPAIFEVQPIFTFYWLIPLYAFLGLYLNRNNKLSIFFGIVALAGIFLAKQVAPPFNDVYSFLFKYFPGFSAFREASKFFFLIALGYAVLIGGFIDWLWKNWQKSKIHKYGTYLSFFLLVFLFVWTIRPAITGELKTILVPRKIPPEYLKLNAFILNQKDYSRTLWLPISPRWSLDTPTHPEVGGADARIVWSKTLKPQSAKNTDTEAELLMESIKSPYANNLIDASSIKYIIVPMQEGKDDDFYTDYGKPRQYYINELNKINYLHRLNLGIDGITVYENYNSKPHIYTTRNKETLTNNTPHQKVEYEFINPTKYKIEFRNMKEPFYLNFSENYHPQWKIRIGKFNWFDALVKKDYFIDNKHHFNNQAAYNSYYLDPRLICQNFECEKETGGNYKIQATLYFLPQSYLHIGSIVSLTSLILAISYILFSLGKRI
jgi:hypothetical protein